MLFSIRFMLDMKTNSHIFYLHGNFFYMEIQIFLWAVPHVAWLHWAASSFKFCQKYFGIHLDSILNHSQDMMHLIPPTVRCVGGGMKLNLPLLKKKCMKIANSFSRFPVFKMQVYLITICHNRTWNPFSFRMQVFLSSGQPACIHC